MKPLVVIPARGGSKGLPGKNIKLLNGKPLIYYTIEAARDVFADNIICVSTDSDQIVKVVEQTGLKVPFRRPAELATDTASSQDVLLHAIKYYQQHGYEPSVIILLQPTSPFRTSKHIKEALKLYNKSLDMVVSVKKTKSNPYFNLFEETEKGYLAKSKEGDFIRRQDCPNVWEYNGAIYVINVASIKLHKLHKFNTVKKYIMNAKESIDIDDDIDWLIANVLINSKHVG